MRKPSLIALMLLLPAALLAQELRTDIHPDSLLAEAERHLGAPYHYGGKTPRGFDCAGFTRYVYARFGVDLPPSSRGQYPVGVPVERGHWRKGDLVFFGGRARLHTIGHVGIVASADSSGFLFIHAASRGVGFTSSAEDYYARRYIGACRLIAPPAPPSPTRADTTPPDTAAPPAPAPPADTVFTIAMVGDIMLGSDYPTPLLPPNGGRHLFDHCRQALQQADIAMGNLEGVLCDTNARCRKQEGPYSYAFRTPPQYAPLLQEAGFDFLNLANNHTNDFGPDGLRQTTALLDSLGIRYSGVKGLCQTALLRRDGTTFGFASFGHNGHTPSISDSALVRRILEPLRYACDILIVSFHGGAEGKAYMHLPDSAETFLDEDRGHLRRFAHLCIDLGADLVHGHGPHVPRAMEAYRGRLVAYSLGNFCTPAGMSLVGPLSYAPLVVARIGRSGALIDGQVLSFTQPYRRGPQPDPSRKAADLIRTLSLQDFESPLLDFGPDGSFRPVPPGEK